MNAIPPVLAIVLPLIASPIALYLGKDRLAVWINALIAAAIFLIAAFFWALFATTLTSNLLVDTTLIVAYIAALAAAPLKALTPYLDISTLFQQSSNTPSTSTPGAAIAQPLPSPLILPTSTPTSTPPTPPTTPAA